MAPNSRVGAGGLEVKILDTFIKYSSYHAYDKGTVFHWGFEVQCQGCACAGLFG